MGAYTRTHLQGAKGNQSGNNLTSAKTFAIDGRLTIILVELD